MSNIVAIIYTIFFLIQSERSLSDTKERKKHSNDWDSAHKSNLKRLVSLLCFGEKNKDSRPIKSMEASLHRQFFSRKDIFSAWESDFQNNFDFFFSSQKLWNITFIKRWILAVKIYFLLHRYTKHNLKTYPLHFEPIWSYIRCTTTLLDKPPLSQPIKQTLFCVCYMPLRIHFL